MMAKKRQEKNPNESVKVEVEAEESSIDETRAEETVETVEADEFVEEPQVVEADEKIELEREIEALKEELEKSQAQADEYLEGWQRARAEFANYKKRVERDQAQVYQNAAGNIIRRYLQVLDDLERALKNRPNEGEGAAWANGIELIYRKLLTILENEGVKPMEVDGQFFDPNMHEAITSEDSDEHESGQVIEVLQQGYLLGDRVLRPALVRVAK